MISVVIPMYNSRKTIEDSICSVLNQTRSDLIDEVVVVDDGSTDGSGQLVKESFAREDKVKVITKKNGGVSTARNAGIKAAKSEWIALLDSDDVWLPEKIEKQWEQIRKHPQIKFIGCNRNHENLYWGKRVDDNLYLLDLRHILIKNWPHTSTALIRREVFREVGLFNEKMRYAEDGDMWNRIACKHPLFYISESLEIAGGQKQQFGESGLSANLEEMYKGNIRNIMVLRKRGHISLLFYVFLKAYNDAKYVRRIILTKILKKKLASKCERFGTENRQKK